MFFADDIEESRDKVSSILELRRKTSESKGFYLSKSKIKYIHYNFSNKQEDDRDKNWRCHTTISKFNHLGSTFHPAIQSPKLKFTTTLSLNLIKNFINIRNDNQVQIID